MKFCKDCEHFRKGIVADGGSLLPGFSVVIKPACYGLPTPKVDLVTGESDAYAGDCSDVRADGTKCGSSAVWFKPATLDGRLAALDDE